MTKAAENQCPRYLTLGHIQTSRPVRVRWSADILKMRSIFTQLTFKRRLPKICQYNRMLYLPTIRSQMATDQNLTGLKAIRKRPPLQKNHLIKYLQGGRWRPLQEPLERPPAAAAPVSIGLNNNKKRPTHSASVENQNACVQNSLPSYKRIFWPWRTLKCQLTVCVGQSCFHILQEWHLLDRDKWQRRAMLVTSRRPGENTQTHTG